MSAGMKGDSSAVGTGAWDWECLFFEGCANWVLVKPYVTFDCGEQAASFLLFCPRLVTFLGFLGSFGKLVQWANYTGEKNPAEENTLIWLLTQWWSFWKMVIVAEVSAAAEEMCMEPVSVNQLDFPYTNAFWICIGTVFWLDPRLVMACDYYCRKCI